MKVLKNEPLSKYTTFKMGGIVKKLYFPETTDELIGLSAVDKGAMKYIIGGGSNLLVNDDKVFEAAICLKDFNRTFDNLPNGRYYIGASVRLQKVIKTINADGYGGIEYLFSVPGLIGGAVYMNAGRGKKHNKCISDYIVSIDYYQDGEIKTIPRENCQFSYRNSVFQRMKNVIIVGVLFEFEEVPLEESKARIGERIDLCKKVQDMSYPNFGTVFCEANKYIIELTRRLHLGYSDGITYSPKTKNWMLHRDNGTFNQAIALIERVKKIHRLFRKTCRVEVKIWG